MWGVRFALGILFLVLRVGSVRTRAGWRWVAAGAAQCAVCSGAVASAWRSASAVRGRAVQRKKCGVARLCGAVRLWCGLGRSLSSQSMPGEREEKLARARALREGECCCYVLTLVSRAAGRTLYASSCERVQGRRGGGSSGIGGRVGCELKEEGTNVGSGRKDSNGKRR